MLIYKKNNNNKLSELFRAEIYTFDKLQNIIAHMYPYALILTLRMPWHLLHPLLPVVSLFYI